MVAKVTQVTNSRAPTTHTYLALVGHQTLGLLGVEPIILLASQRCVRQQVVEPVEVRLREEEVQRLPDETQTQDLEKEYENLVHILVQIQMQEESSDCNFFNASVDLASLSSRDLVNLGPVLTMSGKSSAMDLTDLKNHMMAMLAIWMAVKMWTRLTGTWRRKM